MKQKTQARLTPGLLICMAVVISSLFVGWRENDMQVHLDHVLRYDIFEVVLVSEKSYENPFLDVSVEILFTSPTGKELMTYSFYDGQNTWIGRIAPDEVGIWHYQTRVENGSDPGLNDITGMFECLPSDKKGFIRVDPDTKYWFSYDEGAPFYGVGDTCYGMVNGITDSQRLQYLDARAAQKLNFVRFFASGYEEDARSNPEAGDLWAWGGSPAAPDYGRYNPAFFRRLEGILEELNARGIYAEIEIFNLYSMQAAQSETNYWVKSGELSERWVRYVVSRLSSYTTVFLWTVSNEYEVYPDGVYKYDTSDDEWARAMCAVIHATDPYGHPTTVHPEQRFPGKIFGSMAEVDVITQQQNSYESSHLMSDALPPYWDGPGNEAGDDILAERRDDKPVINTENGYCWMEGYPVNFNMQLHSVDKCRQTMWRIFVSGGGAYAAGFAGTWHGRDNWVYSVNADEKMNVPFWVETGDTGFAAQMGYFYEFVTAQTDFRSMTPANHLVTRPYLCLANAGVEYVVYAPRGGTVRLKLQDTDASFSLVWFNPRTGRSLPSLTMKGGENKRLEAPDTNDWILHLTMLEAGRT